MLSCVYTLKVRLLNHFNEVGASQLNFDLSKALVPLLAQHTDVDSRSVLVRCVEEEEVGEDTDVLLYSCFRSLEASRLLRQLPGSLELLQGYLRSSSHDSSLYLDQLPHPFSG